MNLNSFEILILMTLSRMLRTSNGLSSLALADVLWTCARNRAINGSPFDLYENQYRYLGGERGNEV